MHICIVAEFPCCSKNVAWVGRAECGTQCVKRQKSRERKQTTERERERERTRTTEWTRGWNHRRGFSVLLTVILGNEKWPAVLKGSVAFQSRRGGQKGRRCPRLTLATRGPISPWSHRSIYRNSIKGTPRGVALFKVHQLELWRRRDSVAAKGEVATKANDAVATTGKRVAVSLPELCAAAVGQGATQPESWKKGTTALLCLALADIYPCRHGK